MKAGTLVLLPSSETGVDSGTRWSAGSFVLTTSFAEKMFFGPFLVLFNPIV